ncbi:MAG: hypothetical protein IKJ45_06360, partial [Kiritimatiellae bacterium]|nr:hypothetical protein [Kiritimatiellia bacterium]
MKPYFAIFGALFALGLPASAVQADRVYDGTQADNVMHVDVSRAEDAVLSLGVASPKNENPTYVILAEYGPYESNNCVRISFNGRRERRICGYFYGKRVYSAPGILDDGKLHHVALSLSRGKEMALYIDGVKAASSEIPDSAFPKGWLAVAQRVKTLDPVEAPGWRRWWSTFHFRGMIDDVQLKEGTFDPSCVKLGVWPKSVKYAIPPDPY